MAFSCHLALTNFVATFMGSIAASSRSASTQTQIQTTLLGFDLMPTSTPPSPRMVLASLCLTCPTSYHSVVAMSLSSCDYLGWSKPWYRLGITCFLISCNRCRRRLWRSEFEIGPSRRVLEWGLDWFEQNNERNLEKVAGLCIFPCLLFNLIVSYQNQWARK